ncbi:Leucine-rich repeat-containing protein 45, partial [Cladochytrium tenue]
MTSRGLLAEFARQCRAVGVDEAERPDLAARLLPATLVVAGGGRNGAAAPDDRDSDNHRGHGAPKRAEAEADVGTEGGVDGRQRQRLGGLAGQPTEETEGATTVGQLVLNLAGASIAARTLSALCKALETDCMVESLVLADAFLGDDDQTIRSLDLRGNNIRCDGTLALAGMLKVNATLQSLRLEWNCIGIWESGIRALADAVAGNAALAVLDLRNCKIGPRGAQSLAAALAKGTSALARIDLRWNNAGLVGARALAEAVKCNPRLLAVELVGNDAPEDVLKAIAAHLQRNYDRHTTAVRAAAHSAQLSTTVQALAQHHRQSVRELEDRLSAADGRGGALAARVTSAERDRDAAVSARKDADDRAAAAARDAAAVREEAAARIAGLLGDLAAEKAKREALELQVATATAAQARQAAALDAATRDGEARGEVLRRDKALLLEEVERLRRREREAQEAQAEALARAEAAATARLRAASDRADAAAAEAERRAGERARAAEAARLRLAE